jgi:hypothetical protein
LAGVQSTKKSLGTEQAFGKQRELTMREKTGSFLESQIKPTIISPPRLFA